ncbi:DUF1192 family protein [Temperatibacter marinus]|uniref:DUF1192 family protein n=1 Tax=Temperatibacter marinus TaxID=1456591 RepID=A0AA52H979_9PROT|nr:DUF1192 family protein [Temperatibacter marinus]WND02901.1 DUF1192 family protein [Temperatibacter marinus]
MDMDDLPLRKSDELEALEKQDLSTHGVEELVDRIERLHLEVKRAEAEKALRGDSLSAAEALFK